MSLLKSVLDYATNISWFLILKWALVCTSFCLYGLVLYTHHKIHYVGRLQKPFLFPHLCLTCLNAWIMANQPLREKSSAYTHTKSIFSSISSTISPGLLIPVPGKYLKCTLEPHITFLATPLPLSSLSHQRHQLPLILLGLCVAPFFPKPHLSCSKLLLLL